MDCVRPPTTAASDQPESPTRIVRTGTQRLYGERVFAGHRETPSRTGPKMRSRGPAGSGRRTKRKTHRPVEATPDVAFIGRSRPSAGKERSTNGTQRSPTQGRDSRNIPEACVAYPRSRWRPGEADSPPSSPQEGRGEEPDTGQATSQETCHQAAGRAARAGAGCVNCRSGAARGLHPATDASARADAARSLGPTGGTSSRGRGNGGRGRRGAAVAPSTPRCNASRRTGPAHCVAGPDTCKARLC
jgi:hypothetical protein